MPWQVVEKHEGRETMMRPAIADGFPAYFTKFEAKQLCRCGMHCMIAGFVIPVCLCNGHNQHTYVGGQQLFRAIKAL
jgi:hypothetical protein